MGKVVQYAAGEKMVSKKLRERKPSSSGTVRYLVKSRDGL